MSSDLKNRKEEEYEMQLFGFNSRAVHATLERIVEEKIELCCKKLGESLARIHRTEENIVSIIKNDEKNLARAYNSNSQTHTNIMKRCVKKFVAVPSNVLLDEDSFQANKYSEEEFRNIEERLKNLQLRAKKATILHAAFKEELRLIEEFRPHENGVKMLSSIIENSSSHSGIDSNLIKCVRNSHVLEDTVKELSTNTFSNMYKNSLYNIAVKELDLNDALVLNSTV